MGTLGFLGSAGLSQAVRSVGGGGDGGLCQKAVALSFAQRNPLKVTVTRGRFSQSQCLDTLCLKREGGKSQEEKEIGLFCISYFY